MKFNVESVYQQYDSKYLKTTSQIKEKTFDKRIFSSNGNSPRGE
jgi:hypothetical protein